jgi:phosphinothricin acetyltransferase
MIRLATAADAGAIARIYAPIVEGTVISFETVPPTAAEMERRVTSVLAHAPWLVCARDDESEILGFAYASKHRDRAAYLWSVDVSVYVQEQSRRFGVGRALYTSLLALLRRQGFFAAHAGIALPNPGSVGLHEALGFRPVGIYPMVGYKLGAWHDVGWWQLPLQTHAANPTPPLTVVEAQRGPGWREALEEGLPLLRI